MLIPFTGPLDLITTLESGQAFRWRREGEWLTGVVFENIVRARQTPEGVEFTCAPDDEATIAPLFRDYLRLDDDLEAICDRIRVDDRIAEALLRYPGLRVLRQEPWECLVSFICSANNNVPRISVNVEDIAEHFGRPLELGDCRRSAFPTPARLATKWGSRNCARSGWASGRSTSRARPASWPPETWTCSRSARRTTARRSPHCWNCREWATRWRTASLLMSLDKREAFPVDVWIDRALREWYPEHVTRADGRPFTRAAMRPWAQSYFGEYAGYANQYLFQGRRLLAKGRKTG